MAETRNVEPSYIKKVLVAIGLVVLALFLWKIAPVLILAFAGIVFATAIRAAAVPLSKKSGMSDTAAVILVSTLALAILIAGGYLFGKQIAEQASQLWQAIGAAWGKFTEVVGKVPIGATLLENMQQGTGGDALAKVLKGTIGVFGAVADIVLVLFLALYFAVDPRSYRRGLMRLVPRPARERVGEALDESGTALRKWLLGHLVAMTAVGVLTGLGLWAIGVPLAIPLAILSALLDFVPIIGPIVAAIPGVLIAFGQDPTIGLYAMLVYLAVQFVEGNVIMPIAEKWAVSIPPALSLLGIVAFGVLFGLIGLLFAMPLLVVTMVLVQKLYIERLDQ